MKKTALYIGFFILLLGPQMVFAQSIPCSSSGYTLIYVNGILNTREKAQSETDALWYQIGTQYNGEPVSVHLGYNPTHLAGAGDLIQSLAQQYSFSVSDFDLNTILMQIHPEVTTRKILIVGHSQGAYYSNEMYNYLTTHGESQKSVDVYNVATPSPTTVGTGKYLNSSDDSLLNYLRDALGFKILPPNIDIVSPVDDALKTWPGHSFIGAYLTEAPERIVSDISSELSALTSTTNPSADGCFTPPGAGIGYKTQQALFAVADPSAVVIKNSTVAGVQGAIAVANATGSAVQTAINFFTGSAAPSTATDTSVDEKNFTILKKLYGSSLNTEELKNLLTNLEGAAVVLSTPKQEKPIVTTQGVVAGTSTSVVVVPKATSTFPVLPNFVTSGGGAAPQSPVVVAPPAPIFFSASTTPPVLTISSCGYSLASDFCLLPITQVDISWSVVDGANNYNVFVNGSSILTTSETHASVMLQNNATSTLGVVANDSSGSSVSSDSKTVFVFKTPLVINEIQWAGDRVDTGREWFELKNRTPFTLDLSHLAVSALEGGPQYVPLSGFVEKTFFLIQRLVDAPTISFTLPDRVRAILFEQLDDNGEQLALQWSDGVSTTTLDETPPISACGGWCAGATQDASGVDATVSMERVSADVSGEISSNWASNDTYTATANMPGGGGEPLYATPLWPNSLHLPAFGWFCYPDLVSITAGQSYHPQTDICTYLARFALWPNPVSGALFKGTPGNSTLVVQLSTGYPGNTFIDQKPGNDFSGASAGDDYFAAVWAPRIFLIPNPNDDDSFISYFTTGHRLVGDNLSGFTPAEDTDPPPVEFHVIPFTYAP